MFFDQSQQMFLVELFHDDQRSAVRGASPATAPQGAEW